MNEYKDVIVKNMIRIPLPNMRDVMCNQTQYQDNFYSVAISALDVLIGYINSDKNDKGE